MTPVLPTDGSETAVRPEGQGAPVTPLNRLFLFSNSPVAATACAEQ